MVVEKRRLADVTHLSYAPDRRLPQHMSLVLVDIESFALPLLLNHVAELVSDQAQRVPDFVQLNGGRVVGVRRPKVHVFLGGIALRIQVAGHDHVVALGIFELTKGVETTGDVAVLGVEVAVQQ